MDKPNEDYTTVVVRKGGKLEFDISAPEEGSILRWWVINVEGENLLFLKPSFSYIQLGIPKRRSWH